MSGAEAGWHREDIKASIRKLFGTQEAFAERCGIDAGFLARAIQKPVSIPVERAISEAINVPLHKIWPDRWLPDGRPIGRSERKPNSSSPAAAHRQNAEAA